MNWAGLHSHFAGNLNYIVRYYLEKNYINFEDLDSRSKRHKLCNLGQVTPPSASVIFSRQLPA